MIDAGEIGKVLWLRSQDCFRAGGEGGDPFKGSWRANLKTQGGGELIDTGYHPSYRLLYLAGRRRIEHYGDRWGGSRRRLKARTRHRCRCGLPMA